jgi:hypothetical protein
VIIPSAWPPLQMPGMSPAPSTPAPTAQQAPPPAPTTTSTPPGPTPADKGATRHRFPKRTPAGDATGDRPTRPKRYGKIKPRKG